MTHPAKYSSTQIRTVLTSKATNAQAAGLAGVSVTSAAMWRSGNLPRWFLAERAQERDGARAVRASRFVDPRDARAGR